MISSWALALCVSGAHCWKMHNFRQIKAGVGRKARKGKVLGPVGEGLNFVCQLPRVGQVLRPVWSALQKVVPALGNLAQGALSRQCASHRETRGEPQTGGCLVASDLRFQNNPGV